jgi:hypothetical protein
MRENRKKERKVYERKKKVRNGKAERKIERRNK